MNPPALSETVAPKKATTLRFCKECNNMLYPRESKADRKLFYACRNCDHQEVAEDFLVYRNEIKSSIDINIQLTTPDLPQDPTLPRTRDIRCPKCGASEAVFFQNHMGGRDQAMSLFFVCTDPQCGHRWRE